MTFADIHSLYSEPREFERFFFDLLWKDGFVCSKFRHTRYTTVIRKNGLPQNCLSVLPHCGHQESVTARTALQGTKIPLFSWILVMFDAIAKTGTSVKYISDVTGVSYHTTKLMFRKIKQTQKQENDTHAAIDCDAIELGCIFLWRKKARKTRMESRRQSQCSCGSDQALRLGGHRMVMRKSLKLQILSNSGLYRVKIKLN